LTEAQVQALDKKKADDLAHGEIETEHPGYLGSQDSFYVGTIKGVGRIYQQTFVDTYSKWAAAKLYRTKTPITAADMLNDKVLPFFEEQGMGILRILTDRNTAAECKSMITSFSLACAASSIRKRRPDIRKPTASANAFTRLYTMSFIRSHFGEPSTPHWTLCRLILTHGLPNTTRNGRIKGKCVAGGRP
jgi:hypothetical protein